MRHASKLMRGADHLVKDATKRLRSISHCSTESAAELGDRVHCDYISAYLSTVNIFFRTEKTRSDRYL